MAQKGNQQKNGLDRQSSSHRKGVSDSASALPNGNCVIDEKKIKQSSEKSVRREKKGMDEKQGLEQPGHSSSSSGDSIGNISAGENSGLREENGKGPTSRLNNPKRSLGRLLNGLHTYHTTENLEFYKAEVVKSLTNTALSISNAFTERLERQKPLFITVLANVLSARDYVRRKIEYAYPIVVRWIIHLGNIMLLLSMVWLDCALRGIDSFLRMGTTSFFVVLWCSIISVVAMIGIPKFLLFLALASLMGFLVGFTITTLLVAISGVIFLWIYGSFWTTTLFILFGGIIFMSSHERIGLLITTLYSAYCAWTYVGWLGLLLGSNLSFISSDALVFFLKNKASEQRRPDSATGQPAETGSCSPADRSPGIPSTSGSDSDITSEEEVVRLLTCTDHYSALGLSQFENVDVSILKREYKKKAMLVHPDKNMGNEKAAEAFKKLQNAYEVLGDSSKQKLYDDELRSEELLNCLRRFQNVPQKNRRHGFFGSSFASTKADIGDPLGESRRIACKKCDNFHVWIHTNKSKLKARWCQDCNDSHQAKDGDGWVEQSSQPLLFGILQKVDAPCAYVCADSKIYDATEWYICQGMRCPVNTHKPSFHVNTSITTSKHNNTAKGTSSGQKGRVPTSNMEETMTEEEFMEWLQNAMQAGMFENFAAGAAASDSPGSSSKGGGGGGASTGKRKKKGKKQR
ncbi:hypothetical protein LguiB_025508 [Lonicera macranthoides]